MVTNRGMVMRSMPCGSRHRVVERVTDCTRVRRVMSTNCASPLAPVTVMRWGKRRDINVSGCVRLRCVRFGAVLCLQSSCCIGGRRRLWLVGCSSADSCCVDASGHWRLIVSRDVPRSVSRDVSRHCSSCKVPGTASSRMSVSAPAAETVSCTTPNGCRYNGEVLLMAWIAP